MDYNEIPDLLVKLLRSTDIQRKEICCKLDALIAAIAALTEALTP